ncbi:SDR family NAD(P)-dependent oxidoreductase, partial [Rapidithrix thailandica]
MKYLITGATGVVGGHIARALVQAGKQVKALKRKNSDTSQMQDITSKIEWVEGDILDVFSLEDALKDIDYVIHAAAVVSFSGKQVQQMFKINVEGTANLVNACLQAKVKKLCHISSVAAIGRNKQEEMINETTKWVNSENNSKYGISKYQAEQEVWRGMAEGLDVLVVNPSIVLATGDWNRSSLQILKYVKEGKKYYPSGSLNYVDVRDIAEVVVKLLDSEVSNERFILNAQSIKYRDIFRQIAQKLNVPAPTTEVKRWQGLVLCRLAALMAFFSGKAPLITKETVNSSTSNFVYDSSKV